MHSRIMSYSRIPMRSENVSIGCEKVSSGVGGDDAGVNHHGLTIADSQYTTGGSVDLGGVAVAGSDGLLRASDA